MKNAHIQADWAKWVDEDEEDEAKPLGDDWNHDNMNNFNMGGAGGYPPEGDSDDDEEEEEEQQQPHVHGENCDHEHEAPKKDLGDLDAEEEPHA